MTIKYLPTATCHFMEDDRREKYPSVRAARDAAERYVGNRAAAKLFPSEESYAYGFGDGDTAVMVIQDLDMDAFMGRKTEG